MNRQALSRFLASDLPAMCKDEVHDEAGYALPVNSLTLLTACAAKLQVQRVFEFGSGRSTRKFLAAGCEVAVVEDSESWLSETCGALDSAQRGRLVTFQMPLHRVWLAGAPLKSWILPESALVALRDAHLVLVDSPAWPPFREHALALALTHSRDALIVVDDANIPTVQRFCRRLASRNRATWFQTRMDHGLFFLYANGTDSIDTRRPLLETLKAWRRYFLAKSVR